MALALGLAAVLAPPGPALAARLPVLRPLPALPPALDMREGAPVLAPMAFVRFCLNRPAECAPGEPPGVVALDDTLRDIVEVNRAVNRSIRPQRRPEPSGLKRWAVAPAAGDCNDFAVTKRHELIKRGVPASALLLTVAVTSWGEDHLVLTVRTDRGDYVLDNLTAAIRPWNAVGYTWISRQSAADPRTWVSLEGGRVALGGS